MIHHMCETWSQHTWWLCLRPGFGPLKPGCYSRRSQSLLRPCSSALKTMRSTFRHMSEGSCAWEHKRLRPNEIVIEAMIKGLRQGVQLNTSLGNPLRLWRSCFRKWMSTSRPTMISAKEGRKLTDFLRWLGASEEESTLGMSDQSTALVRTMIKEASLRGHNKLTVFRTAAKLLQATSSKGPRWQRLQRKIWGPA
jgi:hypothetical protein